MEETTTPAATQDPGVVETTQPEEQPAEAAQATTSEPTSTDSAESSQAAENSDEPSSGEFDATEWLSKKGIDPTSPDALAKVAKMQRDAERQWQITNKERADLQKQLTESFDQIPPDANDQAAVLESQVKTLALKDMAREFVDRNPDARANLGEFSGYLKTNPQLQTLTEAGVLTLDQAYAMFTASPDMTDKLKAQGGQETLQKLANKQRATAVQGAASTQGSSPKGNSISELEERLSSVKF